MVYIRCVGGYEQKSGDRPVVFLLIHVHNYVEAESKLCSKIKKILQTL